MTAGTKHTCAWRVDRQQRANHIGQQHRRAGLSASTPVSVVNVVVTIAVETVRSVDTGMDTKRADTACCRVSRRCEMATWPSIGSSGRGRLAFDENASNANEEAQRCS